MQRLVKYQALHLYVELTKHKFDNMLIFDSIL